MMQFDENVWGVNHQWCRFLLAELIRNGVTAFAVSTGSRNTALMVALADFTGIEVLTHYDERGAGFLALGYGRATGKPAAVISTSGTAAANYYPAIIEASAADVPLIIVTADRPVEVRDARTDQVIDQVNIYANYLRWRFDFPAPEPNFLPDHLLTAVDQAVYRAVSSPAGPVHLNVCLRKPHVVAAEKRRSWYQTTKLIEQWKSNERPFTSYADSSKQLGAEALARIAEAAARAQRGLIVCGPMSPARDKSAVAALAARLGWPLLADAASGLRFGRCEPERSNIIAHYELYLRDQEAAAAFRPDMILHFGGDPVNESVQNYLGSSSAEYVLINAHPFRQDPRRNVTFRVDAEPAAAAAALCSRAAPARSALLEPLAAADRLAAQELQEAFSPASRRSQWQLVPVLCNEIPEGSGLFLGNSLPVRELDRFAPSAQKSLCITANRGTSGVDGNIACAVGFAMGLKRPTTVYTGDVALLHDLNSLGLLAKAPVPVTLVVPNNDGGGIFSFLPAITGAACFQDFFTAPHGFRFKGAADMFGLPYFHAESAAAFQHAYHEALQLGRSSIIEVSTDRQQNVDEQRALSSRIVERLRQAKLL